MRKDKYKIAAVIPARMASTRFPGKPLAKIAGLPMVEHVRRRVALCDKLSRVVVATCDREIKDAVEAFGGEVIMTSDRHERCTERVIEAAGRMDADIIVNIQGDEPLVTPQMISQAILPLFGDDKCGCVNLVAPIFEESEFESANAVKAVLDTRGHILYFSREAVPSRKKTGEPFAKYKQLGIIAFTKDALLLYGRLDETPLEKIESVDMMRFLENRYPIKAVITDEPLCGVDTPDELKRAESIMAKDELAKMYI